MGEVTTRITYQVFIEGVMSIIIAEHNRRSLCTTLEVEDKVIKQWDGVTLEKFAEQPYTFYVRGQKFVLLWIIQPEDAEGEDTFELQANGVSLSQLVFLSPDFKLVDEKVPIFNASVFANGKTASLLQFEWKTSILRHRLTEALDDKPAREIRMESIHHPTAVTNEALALISTLKKPEHGFEKLALNFNELEEKVSPTVLDQFVSHCQHLQEFSTIVQPAFTGETGRQNVCELISRIIDEQRETAMQALSFRGYSSKEEQPELPEADKLLINAIVRSGLTQLTNLTFNQTNAWWSDEEARGYLLDFIREQTCLKRLDLKENKFSAESTQQVL